MADDDNQRRGVKRARYYAVRFTAADDDERGAATPAPPGEVFDTWEDARKRMKGARHVAHRRFTCVRDAHAFAALGQDEEAPACGCSRCRVTQRTAKSEEDDGVQHIFTDGAVSHNGRGDAARGGMGVWFGVDDERNASLPFLFPLPVTNNRAELGAILVALKISSDGDGEVRGGKLDHLVIHTDSKYAIERIQAWRERGTLPTVNRDLLERLAAALSGDRVVELRYVQGHDHQAGNVEADALARAGSREDAMRHDTLGELDYRDPAPRRAYLETFAPLVDSRRDMSKCLL